jgi:hypothetical protein
VAAPQFPRTRRPVLRGACACLHVKHVLWEWGLNSPLPRRVPRARPKPQAEIVTDLDILRRLRDHLSS